MMTEKELEELIKEDTKKYALLPEEIRIKATAERTEELREAYKNYKARCRWTGTNMFLDYLDKSYLGLPLVMFFVGVLLCLGDVTLNHIFGKELGNASLIGVGLILCAPAVFVIKFVTGIIIDDMERF